MKILIEVIPHNEQRLGGEGDWIWEGENLRVRVSDMKDWKYNFLLARHEMDEAVLCRNAGITTDMVDQDELKAGDNDDPDSLTGYPGSCYQQQHNDALVAEWIMARNLGVKWEDYGEAFHKLKKKPEKFKRDK